MREPFCNIGSFVPLYYKALREVAHLRELEYVRFVTAIHTKVPQAFTFRGHFCGRCFFAVDVFAVDVFAVDVFAADVFCGRCFLQ